MKAATLVLAALALAACGGGGPEQSRIDFNRNSQFSTEYLRVYINRPNQPQFTVNTLDDAVSSAPFDSPIPGHRGKEWRFVKEERRGTSLVSATASWDPDNPEDYLMAGWWAYFPGQHPPNLDPFTPLEYAIVDGPEIDPALPPDIPLSGTASYVGLAGGIYAYAPGVTIDKEEFPLVSDAWEGVSALTADFAAGTISGCIGCVGDLTRRAAVVPLSRGEVAHDITDYEIHLGALPLGNGNFDGNAAQIRHPDRELEHIRGYWGGGLSNKPDAAGNPRIVTGFAVGSYEEEDESRGYFFGAFVGLSEELRRQQ